MATKKKPVVDIAEYKVPASLISTIEKEVKKRNEDLQSVVESQKTEITGLRSQIAAMAGSALATGKTAVEEIFGKLDEERIVTMLGVAIPPTYGYTFKKSSWASDNVPIEFQCHVNFYNDRFLVYRFFDELGIKYKEWTKQVILPHEWDRDCLSLFLDNLNRQYVCNGCFFDDNLHFWYKEHKERLVDPVAQIKHDNYSEIPWQFILKNPKWADDELIERIAEKFRKNEYGSRVEGFLKLPNYNSHITAEQYITLASSIKSDEAFKKFFDSDTVRGAIFKLGGQDLRKRVLSLIEVRDFFPATYQEDYINKMPFDRAMSYIHNSKTFNETEKAGLVNNVVKRQYSKEAILERVLSD